MLVFPKVGNYYIATAPPIETPKDSVDIIAVSHVISLETIVLDWQTQLVDWFAMVTMHGLNNTSLPPQKFYLAKASKYL